MWLYSTLTRHMLDHLLHRILYRKWLAMLEKVPSQQGWYPIGPSMAPQVTVALKAPALVQTW